MGVLATQPVSGERPEGIEIFLFITQLDDVLVSATVTIIVCRAIYSLI